MVSERKSMLLHLTSGQQINDQVWKHHNYNGLEASDDLATIARAHAARNSLRKSMPLWFGMTVFSGYNITRMGVLSNSGRMGAIGGLALGAIMTVTTLRI